MSPIADYDLGKARGRIVIDFDDKGTSDAQEQFQAVEEQANKLVEVFQKLTHAIGSMSHDFVGHAKRFSAAFGLMAGGAAVLLGLSRATNTFTGSIFKMRGVLGILGSLGLLLGGVPKSIEGFPSALKKIVLLSAAIGLFAKSTNLLDGVVKRIGKFVGSTAIVQKLAHAFPGLTSALGKLGSFIPSIGQIGKSIDGWSRPIHKIASMTLLIGSLITVFRNGTKAALALTKSVLALGAGALVINGLIFLIAGLGDAAKQASGLLGLIPGAIATIGLAGATVAIGLQGFKDALKNMNDEAKFNEALKNLAPSAQKVAIEIKGLQNEWTNLRKAVQQKLFEGIANDMAILANKYIPIVRNGFVGIATTLNGMAKEVANFFKQTTAMNDVNTIFNNVNDALGHMKGLIQPLLSILTDVFVVSTQVFAEMAGELNHAAGGFANFVHEARESGALAQWIRDGVDALKSMIEIVARLGSIFSQVFGAFDENADGFLATVEKMVTQVDKFLMSTQGQDLLQTFVDLLKTLSSVTKAVLRAGLSELGPIIRDLLPFLKEMAQTISAVLVTAIKILGPILDGVAKALSAMAPVLGPVVGFFLAWSITMGALSAGIGLAVTAIGFLVGAIGSVIKVVKTLAVVFAANPWLAVIAILATLAVLIIQNWDVIGPKLKAIWEGIKSVAETVWNAIKNFFVEIWNSIKDFFVGIWNDIANTAKSVWDSIAGFFEDIWNGILNFFKDIGRDIAKQWQNFVDTFRPIFEPLIDIAKSIFSIIRDTIIIIVGAILIGLKYAWEGIKTAAVASWNAIRNFFVGIWNDIVTQFHYFFDPIVEFLSSIWSDITTQVTAAWTAVRDFFVGIWNDIVTQFHTYFDPIAQFFADLWNTVSTGISTAWNSITSYLAGIWSDITSQVTSAWNAIGDFFSNIWNSKIVTAVRDGVSDVVDWISSLPGKIWDKVKNAGKWLWDAGKAVIKGFLDGLRDAFRAVADWVGGIKDWIVDHKGPVEKDRKILIPAGEAIMLGFLEGLQSKQTVIQRFLESFATDIQNGIGNVNGAMASAANLNATSTLGIVTSIPFNANTLASSVTPVQTAANGTSPSGGDGAAVPTVINIQQLELHVAGNLDPTKPVEWRNAMKNIKDGLRGVDRGYPQNG